MSSLRQTVIKCSTNKHLLLCCAWVERLQGYFYLFVFTSVSGKISYSCAFLSMVWILCSTAIISSSFKLSGSNSEVGRFITELKLPARLVEDDRVGSHVTRNCFVWECINDQYFVWSEAEGAASFKAKKGKKKSQMRINKDKVTKSEGWEDLKI